MENAATNDDVKTMDPNTMIKLNVVSKDNAGRAPSTRWGKVSFDENGEGTVEMPLKDIALFSQLKWLRPEDMEKYLGISQQAAAVVTTEQASDLQQQLDATKSANVRLATKNAELEAKLDEILARYQKEFKGYEEKVMADMQSIREDLDKANDRMNAVAAENDALKNENAALKAQLAPPAEKAPETKPETPAAKAEKAAKK